MIISAALATSAALVVEKQEDLRACMECLLPSAAS